MDSRRANLPRRVVPAMRMVTANKQTLREERMGGASVLITKGTRWSAHPSTHHGDHDAHPAHHVELGTTMPTPSTHQEGDPDAHRANPADAHARDLCRT